MVKRQLRDASDPLSLPEGIFKQLYRLSRATAHHLLLEISPLLPQREREAIALPTNLIVLCALHFYAQGSYQRAVGQDLNVPMCQASVSNCITAVTNVLNDHFAHLVHFPITLEEKNSQKNKFMQLANGFPGIIGAIDCTHVRIHPPPINDEDQPGILFYNRKHFHSINVQCIVGADLKLLAMNARYPGSVHDSAIWSTSQIRNHLIGQNDRSSWLLGDSGYPLEPWLMTPVVAQVLNESEARYNFAHRSCRNVVERFNGVLKSRFRCCFAERTLHYAPEKAGRIINACGILHNICIDHGDIEENNEMVNNEEDVANNPNAVNYNFFQQGRLTRQRIINDYFH